jgi:hypothetical protein
MTTAGPKTHRGWAQKAKRERLGVLRQELGYCGWQWSAIYHGGWLRVPHYATSGMRYGSNRGDQVWFVTNLEEIDKRLEREQPKGD